MVSHSIAVIPGDGIGTEIMEPTLTILDELGQRYGFSFEWQRKDWSCEYYAKTGRMMPEDGLDQLAGTDGILLGAVGYPGVPDHVSLWGLLIPIRRAFRQYVNLRPGRCHDRLDRDRSIGEPQPGTRVPVDVRARARVGT